MAAFSAKPMNTQLIATSDCSEYGAHFSLTERIVLSCLCALAVLLAPLLEERE